MTAGNPDNVNQLIAAARDWYEAGYCVVPSHEDQGKRPWGKWKDYQTERLQWDALASLLATGKYTGIGVICGTASGNVEGLEIEGPMDAAVARLTKVIEYANKYTEIGVPDLFARVARGCVEQSAGGGLHMFIRVTDGPALGNTKLAFTPDATQAGGRKVVAETRGENGFMIVAPSPGRSGHAEGATYMFLNGGSPRNTVNVTAEERDLLHYVIGMSLNEIHDEPTPTPAPAPTPTTPYEGESTFDAFRKVTWASILEPQGWTHSHADATRNYWIRPGKSKNDGISASTIEDGPLVNFSSNSGLPTEQGMSKAAVFAHFHHAGNLSAAAQALFDQGYGERRNDTLTEFIFTPQQSDTPQDLQDLAALKYEQRVRERALDIKIGEDARTLLNTMKLGAIAPLEPVSVDAFLREPDEEERYRVEGLWPAEGRVLLAAAAKSGKTTMMVGNLIPCLVDGGMFLGRFEVQPVTGTVVLLNMEVGPRTLRNWVRKAGIQATHKAHIVNLRGNANALQLNSEQGRARLAKFLQELDAEVVILDPLAPVLASLGLDENDNSQVATFFSWWSEALNLAGVKDDIVVHHTGHAGKRSRGASRLLDEPDAIWTLARADTTDGDEAGFQPLEARFLHAYGRDVELPESMLAFDGLTGRLTLQDMTPEQHKATAHLAKYFDRITEWVTANVGKSGSQIATGIGAKKEAVLDALNLMRDRGLIDFGPGSGRGFVYFPPSSDTNTNNSN